jgi:cyclopropane-fatty-acyl-phospholipid synthase
VQHAFEYSVVYYVLSLTEPPRSSKLFGWNQHALLSFKEQDYLNKSNVPIVDQVRTILESETLLEFGHSIQLVTNLKLLGYVFNPVSFYFCYNQAGKLGALLAEVNNTFGEKHLYVTHAVDNDGRFNSKICKDFHVSPFYDSTGEYLFRFKDVGSKLDVSIDLYREGKLELATRINETCSRSFNDKEILRVLLQQPLVGLLTFPRIVWHALILKYLKKLTVYKKPHPRSPMTLRIKPPNLLEKFAMSRVFLLLSKLNKGRIKIILPDKNELVFGLANSADEGVVIIRSYSAFIKILKSGDIGFGDSYVEGGWETPDLGAVLKVLTMNLDTVDDRTLIWSWIGRFTNILRHVSRFNSVKNSRSNIQRHYDLSNDLFRSFLDKSMTYSCAIFKNENDSLEDAQKEKIRELIAKADLKPTDRVLEIGCGWGSFAIMAAKEIGCHVTGITISEEQRDFVVKRVKDLGLDSKVNIQLLDYRKLEGEFDKIVSIEMIEAVGHKYLGTFFRVCDRLLKPNGKIVIQAITIPDQRYTWYRFGCDWIQRHIFPGGSCPSLKVLNSAVSKNSSLVVKRVENFGVHYALTLREWRKRFLNSFEDTRSLGFDDRFKRLWTYYLTYCEEGFSCKAIDTLHLVLERSGEKAT